MADFLFLDSPLFLPIVIVGVVIASILLMKGRFRKSEKEYEPEKFTDTINKDLKRSMDLHGEGFSLFSPGKLYLGMKVLGIIDKYYFGSGKFASYYFDDEKKDFMVEEKDKDETYNLAFIRIKGPSFFHKIFAIGKRYIIVKRYDKGKKELLHFDVEKRRIILPSDTHLQSYGNVWHNCFDSLEYVNDIAMKRLNETTMTHLQCFPDKIVLFNEEQLKKERLGRIYSEIESKKWEKRKNAEDTVIE